MIADEEEESLAEYFRDTRVYLKIPTLSAQQPTLFRADHETKLRRFEPFLRLGYPEACTRKGSNLFSIFDSMTFFKKRSDRNTKKRVRFWGIKRGGRACYR